jgi:hypothetical protein
MFSWILGSPDVASRAHNESFTLDIFSNFTLDIYFSVIYFVSLYLSQLCILMKKHGLWIILQVTKIMVVIFNKWLPQEKQLQSISYYIFCRYKIIAELCGTNLSLSPINYCCDWRFSATFAKYNASTWRYANRNKLIFFPQLIRLITNIKLLCLSWSSLCTSSNFSHQVRGH